ncbi:hypothetical protein NXK88_002659 [Enterococcus hirae]|uniref:hypothetical protein n=1 Tax=Enterococcus hirae TaxID=1354 RepID=UPI0020732EC5|nr:hypothetical protein [Enterococcus hirae]EMF0203391.1 hypothetical protein [Enterococcus hirae]
MNNECLKEYLKLIHCSKGITYEEFCLRGNGSMTRKNKWLRFLLHQHYVYRNEANEFYLSRWGNQLLEKL